MGEAIIITNSSTIRSMKDTVATAGQSKISHLNQRFLHITKKSKHLTVKLIKGMIMTTTIASLWRSDKSTPMSLGETPSVEQKPKKGKTLQTKNIKVITREDILSNRYELDPFYNDRPNSTARASRSSSFKSRRKSSSNMTIQLMTQQEFQREVSHRPSITSLNHPTRNRSVRFHIRDTEERFNDAINEKEEVYTDAMVYELDMGKGL
ncbi:hypothetical protein WICPIJ_006375 [Wickerhamomyces pijperi]|uniref:Uncharacterized protein n=1 Tax=Wickerhamomyces pijperi TaxID=599730 RepID=A0A9P8Q274_WICPI|nr:hypothetical protein WICPIJ_006375 [Wickerhamomyces pijperi]